MSKSSVDEICLRAIRHRALFPKRTTFEARLRDDLGIDSFSSLNLVGDLEREFNIEVPEAELTAKNFSTVASLIDLVKRLIEK